VFLGFKSEGVNVDTSGGNVGVMLVRLDQVEVRSESLLETIVTVKLELGTDGGVSSSVDGAKTGVISIVSSSGKSTEISGGKIGSVGSRADWESWLSYLRIGLGSGESTSTSGDTGLVQVFEVFGI
jgi:hypothetical protein